MKKLFVLFVPVFLCALSACVKKMPKEPSLLNLNFEEFYTDSTPAKWFIESNQYYTYEIVEEEGYNYLQLTNIAPRDSVTFGVFTGVFPLSLVKGKDIEFSAEIKTENVEEGYAGLWWRVDGSNGSMLGFDNMRNRGITGSTDWQEVTITMNVDEHAVNIVFGGLFPGNGSACFRNLEIFIDGTKFEDINPAPEPTKEEIAWLKQYVYPLKTFDPAARSDKDINVLDKLIGDASVVALGESTHGSREIFQMKHRIMKYLAENKGFDIFSIEANMPESYKLNSYIIHGQGSPDELIRGMYFWTWRTEEVLDMVEWMKLYNDNGGKIQFTGFDMQTFAGPIQELRDAFESDPSATTPIVELNSELIKLSKRPVPAYMQFIAPDDKLMKLMQKVGETIETSSFDEQQKEWLRRNHTVINQFIDMRCNWNGSQVRDESMADNLLWIKRTNPDSKIVTWAHNGHIWKEESSMGYYLDKELEDDHIAIGFATSEGTYTAVRKNMEARGGNELQLPCKGSYEYYFDCVEEPIFILDLKSAKKDPSEHGKWLNDGKLKFRAIGAVVMNEQFWPGAVTDGFDYIIFIKKTNHSVLLGKQHRSNRDSLWLYHRF